jgi:hypothetical protein
MKRFFLSTLLTSTMFVATGGAQTVNQRRENQQDRIGQGVTSGQLTAGETARLERQEARLNHQIADDREDHKGHLTARERRQINREQNGLSKEIYRLKHNRVHQ